MKKSLLTVVLSVLLAVIMATLPSLQVAAAEVQSKTEYISEVKIGVGKTADEAEKALDGYTILKDGKNNVDLNQKAGGGIGSKGERVVYLGFKTTTDRSEAITDLAVMNMKGGYSVKDYELLMKQYMTEQIIPFVENFVVTIKEYRENYNSSNEENKARAQYVHDALNKLTDDDCGDAGLGDLFLNETKYEMGDAAYEALSEEEKKQHADIVTIISQANGKATLIIENLITRAADTNEDTWMDRFKSTSYNDLLSLYPDMLPTEAEAQLAKDYDNVAREILEMWSALGEQLEDYDEKVERLNKLTENDLAEQKRIADEYDPQTATEEQTKAYYAALAEIEIITDAVVSLFEDITLKDYLSSVEYGEGTLADFFMQDYQTVADNITVLYPLAASLSPGQRAGLEFVTLADLIMFSETDSEGYKQSGADDIVESSIYEGVNREIYQKGGVALTNEALRAHSAEELVAENGILNRVGMLSKVIIGAAAVSVAAFAMTGLFRIADRVTLELRTIYIKNQAEAIRAKWMAKPNGVFSWDGFYAEYNPVIYKIEGNEYKGHIYGDCLQGYYDNRSAFCSKMMIGFGVAAVVLSGIGLYLSYRDLVDYYNVDYSPIPKYMVDEKDITAYNEKGEKIIVKNQSAYYKTVETNRAEGDEWFDILGASADINGTVGRQWLALYAAKNENEAPIKASSLKAVVGKTDVPAGYSTGIHMFGSDAAYNLNNTQVVWNNDAPGVFVYFTVDTAVAVEPTTAGSSFSAGYMVLASIAGLVIGAGLGALVLLSVKRKKFTKEA